MGRYFPIKAEPADMLWHVAHGRMPGFTDETFSRVGWVSFSHRGVQYLDKFHIAHKRQERYIMHKKWEIKFDTAFEEVVRACADTERESIARASGKTWINDELIEGLLKLHKTGHAHSYEAWTDGKLAAGVWGFQLGGFVSMNSMFYRVNHGGKAALARGQMQLKERGFKLVDMNGMNGEMVNFGIEWARQWKFAQEVADLAGRTDLSLEEGKPTGVATPGLLWKLKAARKVDGVVGRLKKLVGVREADLPRSHGGTEQKAVEAEEDTGGAPVPRREQKEVKEGEETATAPAPRPCPGALE